MSRKPDWMDENEYNDEQRRVYSQLVYDMYHAPEWVKKAASVMAAVILVTVIASLLIMLIAGVVSVVFP